MRIKTISIIVTICLLMSANSSAEAVKKNSVLRVYLPREITINSDVPNLGQVGIIRGEESLAADAADITLGQISLPGQKLVVDRHLILSRLACNGIPASKVILTGAEKVLVKRQHQTIKGKEFLDSALSFLKKVSFDSSVCEFTPLRTPEDLVIPGEAQDIKLLPRLVKSRIRNRTKVCVAAVAQGEEIGMREISFQLKYSCRRAVTLMDIPQGALINSENVKIEKFTSNYPEPADWAAPYGLIARRRLPAKTMIRNNMTGRPEPPILLKRNQNVVIQIDKFGILLTVTGKTMQPGRVGEYIKVRNVDSQRIILAKVNEDGTVEPVF